MTGNEYLLRSIAALGVGHLFVAVGGLIEPFLPLLSANGSSDETVAPVVCANEAGVTYAADGYARASGKFGVGLMIGGPGAFNAVGGVAAARADTVPLLLLTGETATAQQGRGAFQDNGPLGIGDLGVFAGLSNFSHFVPHAAALPQFLREAVQTMLCDPHQPVHLALPTDVQADEVTRTAMQPRAKLPRPRILDHDAFGQYGREVLGAATRVALLVGGGVIDSDACEVLVEAAEQLQIPVATTFRAKGAIPDDHPLCLGVFGYGGHPSAEDCLLSPDIDTLLVLGSSLNQRDSLDWNAQLQPQLGIAQVNLDPRMLGRNLPVRYRVLGDARAALEALRSPKAAWAEDFRVTARARRRWADGFLKESRFLAPENLTSDAVPIHPARVIGELRKALPRDAALLVDNGVHRAFATHYFPVYQPRRLFSATTLGPMGWAIAASIGVATALPSTPVAVVTGDGCMLQNGVEIQTAARYRLKILYVVMNNSASGNIYLRAKEAGPGPQALSELPTHDWAAFAGALGVPSARVDTPSGLAAAFNEFMNGNGPALVDVRVDRDALPPVTARVDATRHPDVYAE